MLGEMKGEAPAQPRSVADRLATFAKQCIHEIREKVALWQERRALEQELGALSDDELRDIGLMRYQIPQLVESQAEGALLIDQMLARLGIDSVALGPLASRRDYLYRACALCTHRRRCKHWLASGKDEDGYRAFCPNTMILDKLRLARAVVKAQEVTVAH